MEIGVLFIGVIIENIGNGNGMVIDFDGWYVIIVELGFILWFFYIGYFSVD